MTTGFEPDAVVTVAGLSKHYGKARALDDVSFRLEPGVVYGLLGPNGSGKTTCLHLQVGLLTATHGEIAVCGHPAGSTEARRSIGFAPDDLPLPQALTGLEFLEFHERMRGRGDLASTGLALAESLSIATSLHTVPEAGGTALIATHDMLHAEHDCTEVLILTEGRTVAQGTPRRLIDSYPGSQSLEDVFFAATGLLEARADRLDTIIDLLGDKRSELIDKEGADRS